MSTVLVLLVLPLAALAGYATRRGNVCAVLAVEDIVLNRDARRFLGFLLAAAAAALIGLPLAWTRPDLVRLAPAYDLGWLALAGGAVFGAGAVLNGGCAFGTLARIAGGNFAYLLMLPGAALGFALASAVHVAPAPATSRLSAPSAAATAALLAALAVVAPTVWALRRKGRLGLTDPRVALLVIGLAGGLLYALLGSWTVFGVVGRSAAAVAGMAPAPTTLALGAALALMLGAIGAAVAAGGFRPRWIGHGQAARSLGGGVLMGVGAGLVPGGNDTLVLHALPGLAAYGVLAYVAMCATLFLVVGTMRLVGKSGLARPRAG